MVESRAMRSPRESGPTRQQDLGVAQLGWLAAAVFVVSAGYGALMPLIPDWLRPLMGDADPAALARHVGYLSGIYTAGILLGAPLWGMLADRLGRARVLLVGLIGYVASLLPLLRPESLGVVGIYALRGATGFFVAAVVPVVPALVAQYTPESIRARRFAWLGAMSLLGFLFGPGLNAAAERLVGLGFLSVLVQGSSTTLVIALSAALGRARRADDAGPGRNASRTFLPWRGGRSRSRRSTPEPLPGALDSQRCGHVRACRL